MPIDLQAVWQRRSEGQVLEALSCLDEYSADAQAAIRAECARRGLEIPPRRAVTFEEASRVAQLHRQFIGWILAEWVSLAGLVALAILDLSSRPTIPGVVGVSVFMVARFKVPITGYRLLKQLEVDSPGPIAALMYAPAIGLLITMWLGMLTRAWGRRYELDVNFLGPTKQQLLRLRH